MRPRGGAPAGGASRDIGEAYRLGETQEVGRTLLSLGYVDQSDLAKALASRLRLEFIELSIKDVDPEAAGLVDKKLLRKHRMLPLRVEDGRLVVAMRDPTNLYALEDLRMLTGYPVNPVGVAESDLRRAFGAVFGAGDEVAELLEEAAAESPARAREEVELGEDRGPTGAPTVRLVGSILRCDPDVVMIGEIRDRETDKTSVEAALTGHLVLTTFRIY